MNTDLEIQDFKMERKTKYLFNEPICEYIACFYEDGKIHKFAFNERTVIDDNPSEWLIAISDITQDVSELEVNESIYFQGNRDNEHTKGFIVRVK